MSYLDCALRKNECYDRHLKHPNISGFCVVGKIIGTSQTASSGEDSCIFKTGDRIATILFKGGNARYVAQRASRMIKISDGDDGKQICGLLCASIAAFACLQHFIPVDNRYNKKSHVGESIFVNGGMSLVGQAVIQICSFLGATKVFATGLPRDFQFLKKLGAIPIPINVPITDPALEKQVDTVIDCTSFDDLHYLQKMLKKNGRVVYYEYGNVSESGRHGWRSDIRRLFLKCKLIPHYSYASFCDPLNIFYDDFIKFKVRLIAMATNLSICSIPLTSN